MRRTAAALLAALVAGALATLPGQAVPPGGVKATEKALGDQATVRRFAVYDASGRRVRDAAWRVTEAGGNCCEVFVAATPDGRLLEFGGRFPTVSDDRGATWHEVLPGTLNLGGEGAISAAPGGDVVGVGWDPYTGDRLEAFVYDGEARDWRYAQVPLHEPLHDRPWIAVVPGPFKRVDGSTAPYATVVRANYLSAFKETFLYSLDGLTYLPMQGNPLGLPRQSGYLSPAHSSILDYVQPQHDSRMTVLAGEGLLNMLDLSLGGCDATLWSFQQTWSCFTIPDHPIEATLVMDSRGRLHEAVLDEGVIVYKSSPDGGETWYETTLALPDGMLIDAAAQLDHKVNAANGVGAVAVHAHLPDRSVDAVFRIDVSGVQPRLVETMLVGDNDRPTGRGVSETGARFDFASVAILPDGSIATAFYDMATEDPALAVEVREPKACRKRC